MTQFAANTYTLIVKVFKIIGLAEQEITQKVEEFEESLVKKFVEAVVVKLPEQERKQIIDLANKTDGGSDELQQKLSYWFNEEETKKLFIKISNQLFNELLQNAYKDANEEQKKKLEEVFKPEVLRG